MEIGPSSSTVGMKAIQQLGLDLWLPTLLHRAQAASLSWIIQRTLLATTAFWSATLVEFRLFYQKNFKKWEFTTKLGASDSVLGQDCLLMRVSRLKKLPTKQLTEWSCAIRQVGYSGPLHNFLKPLPKVLDLTWMWILSLRLVTSHVSTPALTRERTSTTAIKISSWGSVIGYKLRQELHQWEATGSAHTSIFLLSKTTLFPTTCMDVRLIECYWTCLQTSKWDPMEFSTGRLSSSLNLPKIHVHLYIL